MKKKGMLCHLFDKTHEKIWMIMKLCIIFVVFLTFTTYAKSSGQEQTVSLKLNQASFYELFEAIRLQTGLRFLYNADQLKQMPVVNVSADNKKVRDVLTDVLLGTPLTFMFDKDVVMLVKRTDAAAQQKTVKVLGRVTDEKKQPLPGVTIMVKGTKVGTATDKDGKYRFTAPQTDNLTFIYSFIGMVSVEVKYTGKDTINVVMKEELAALDAVEIVATGYQNINRRDMVGSYKTVKAEDIMMPAYNSIDQMLQGKIAGMMVMNSSSRVGSSPSIQIRGTSTLLGNTAPLWVVDGVIQPDPIKLEGNAQLRESLQDIIGSQISWLNPQDIETITVLKDASAAAIYGSKASNGVIVVTTKRGKIDRLTVNYTGNFSTTSRPNYDQFNMMNSQERMIFSEEAADWGSYYMTEPYEDLYTYEGLQKLLYNGKIDQSEFLTRKASLESVNTDWFKLLTRRAFSQNHNLSVSGGAEKFTYSVSLGYGKDQGQEIGNSEERFTGRVALNATLRKNVTLNVTINGNRSEVSNFITGVSPISYATSTSRSVPAFDENGDPAFYQKTNGYQYTNSVIKTLGYNFINERDNSGVKTRNSLISGALDFKWDMTSWLAYQFTGGYNQTVKTSESYHGEKTFNVADQFRGYDYGTEASGSDAFKAAMLPFGGDLYTVDATQTSYNVQNKLLLSKSFNEDHRVNAMLAMEVRSSRTLAHYNTLWGYSPERGKKLMRPTPIKDLVPMGNSVPLDAWGPLEALYSDLNGAWKSQDQTDNFFSWFATVAYSLKNRYVFNFNIRNDESNRFGQNVNKRIDPTYSLGASWRVMDEPFLANQQDWLSMLVFRVTYGIQGNVLTNKSPDLVLSRQSSAEYFNEYYSTVSSIPNPFLKWERTKAWNLGVDLELFRMFNVTAEYYRRSSNALVSQNIPYEYGITLMDVNGGRIVNSGMEFTVAFTPINKKDMALSISLNASKNWNKTGKPVTEINYGSYTNGMTNMIVREGYPIGGFWSYSFAGLSPEDGHPLFNNIDMDEKERNPGVDPLTYLTYSGTKIPYFTGGLSLGFRYKSFNLGADFALQLGAKKRLPSPFKNTSNGVNIPDPTLNLSRDLLKRWQRPGDEAKTTIPSLVRANETYQYTLPDNRRMYWMDMWDLSDERVVDASFLRCTQINLTYRMNQELCKRIGFKSLSISGIVNNAFVIASDRFDGFDPELGDSVMPQKYSLGINVGF